MHRLLFNLIGLTENYVRGNLVNLFILILNLQTILIPLLILTKRVHISNFGESFIIHLHFYITL